MFLIHAKIVALAVAPLHHTSANVLLVRFNQLAIMLTHVPALLVPMVAYVKRKAVAFLANVPLAFRAARVARFFLIHVISNHVQTEALAPEWTTLSTRVLAKADLRAQTAKLLLIHVQVPHVLMEASALQVAAEAFRVHVQLAIPEIRVAKLLLILVTAIRVLMGQLVLEQTIPSTHVLVPADSQVPIVNQLHLVHVIANLVLMEPLVHE